jgi:predicted MFS family arabinose efflux permease
MERNRGGSLLTSLLVGTGLFGTFLFLTYYFQAVLHYSALKTGFAFLPFSAGIIVGATISSQLLPRLGPRLPMGVGLALGVASLAWFTQIGPHTSYPGVLLPAEVILSFGLGMAFVPFSSSALIGVAESDSGVASALVNATQQVGGSLGVALLNTVAVSATASYLSAHHGAAVRAVVHGYATAYVLSALIVGLAFLAGALLVRASRNDVIVLEPAAP